MSTQRKAHEIIGEEGVEKRQPHIYRCGFLDDEYDNGTRAAWQWDRRNYHESCYLSGTQDLEPGEYGMGWQLYRNDHWRQM